MSKEIDFSTTPDQASLRMPPQRYRSGGLIEMPFHSSIPVCFGPVAMPTPDPSRLAYVVIHCNPDDYIEEDGCLEERSEIGI